MSTKAPTPVPHPVATANRQAKAVRVVQFIESNPRMFSGHTDPDSVANFPAPLWATINECMGEERPMSPLTISMVVGMLTVRGL